MSRENRLEAISLLLSKAKSAGNVTVDVEFLWKYEIFIVMRDPLDQTTRDWISSDPNFKIGLTERNPHDGVFSWAEAIVDEESSIVVLFPRPISSGP